MISPSTSNLCLAFHTMLFWMHATSHKSALRRRLGIVNEDIVMFGTYGVGHPWHTTHSQQYAHPCWFLIFPLVKCECVICKLFESQLLPPDILSRDSRRSLEEQIHVWRDEMLFPQGLHFHRDDKSLWCGSQISCLWAGVTATGSNISMTVLCESSPFPSVVRPTDIPVHMLVVGAESIIVVKYFKPQ